MVIRGLLQGYICDILSFTCLYAFNYFLKILWVFLDLFQSTKNLTFGFKEEFASCGMDATLAKVR